MLERVAYHEAGHTVAAEMLEAGGVNLVTVRRNTGKVGGFTCQSFADDYWISKTQMENHVITLLAGKAATEIVFGEADTGANSDLQGAFSMVQRFLEVYCAYGYEFGIDLNRPRSDTLIRRKEDRVAADLDIFYARAKKLLIENRAFLDGIAKRLQEKDTLIYSEIKEIKAKTVGLSA